MLYCPGRKHDAFPNLMRATRSRMGSQSWKPGFRHCRSKQ